MADPRVFDTPVGVAVDEALAEVSRLLEGIPESRESFAARYGNEALFGSLASLVEAARDDRMVRDAHGLKILTSALAMIAAHRQPAPRPKTAGKG